MNRAQRPRRPAPGVQLLQRGLWLEHITLGWNVVGVGVLAWSALAARSVALAGFGLDSLIEIGASLVVVWELIGRDEGRQHRALRLIGSDGFHGSATDGWSAILAGMTTTSQPADDELRPRGGRKGERQFGWQDMFVGPDADPRGIGGIFVHHGDERTVLAGYLHDYRLTLELKCAGLGPEAMARRSVEPSDLSLLGLVRHLSDAERYWFRQVMAEQDAPARYRASAGDVGDRAFSDAVADPAAVVLAWDNWRAEVSFAERFVDETGDLDLTKPYVGRGGHQGQVSLREVLVHMIEEYARHIGHADLLRERIDGRVGL